MAKNFVLPSLGLSLVAALGLASCDSAQIDLPVDPLLLPQQERGPDYGLDHDEILDNVGDIFKDGRQLTQAEGEAALLRQAALRHLRPHPSRAAA